MPTVMVVDDTAIIRETVARILRKEGYTTVCASNGKEALETIQAAAPDIMLLDIMMPEMDGMATLAHLRQNPRWHSLPIIMMTALSDDEHQSKAEMLGASDYMVKARVSIDQMLQRMRRLLDVAPQRSN
jgi:CheY-like chemotaxis protein